MQSVKRSPTVHDLERFLNDSLRLKESFIKKHAETLLGIGFEISERLRRGSKLIVAGNGGSATDAQHFAAELMGRFETLRNPIPCLALPANMGLITAVGNDFGYEQVFARQIEALGKKDDVFLAISTSGNSPNILLGAQKAMELSLLVIGLTGFGGGKLKEYVHVLLDTPLESSTPRVQETHIFALHTLAWLIESSLSP